MNTKLCGRCKLWRMFSCLLTDGGRLSKKVRKCPNFIPSKKYNVQRDKVEFDTIKRIFNAYGLEIFEKGSAIPSGYKVIDVETAFEGFNPPIRIKNFSAKW